MCSTEVPNPIQTGDLPSATATCVNGMLTSVSGGITAQSFRSPGNLEACLGTCDTSGLVGAEGTAMLEIVHDLAPGAQLYFANFDTSMSFQSAVDFLALNTDVAVDDIQFFTPPFDGTSDVSTHTAQALNTDTNPIRGYFTAVGNQARNHYEGLYADSGVNGATTFGLPNDGDLHLFGTSSVPNVTPSVADPIFLLQGGAVNILLSWDDPFGASSNDYDLFLVDACTGAIVDSSTNPQTGMQEPTEQILGFQNPNTTNEAVPLMARPVTERVLTHTKS
jgi:hypothetical protein